MPAVAAEPENGRQKSQNETKENLRGKATVITAAESRSHWKLNLLPLWPNDNIVPPSWCFCRKGRPGALLGGSVGVPKITPMFGDLLEGLIELSIYLLLTKIHTPRPIPAASQQ